MDATNAVYASLGVAMAPIGLVRSSATAREYRSARAKGSSSVNCKFLHLLDVHKAYDVRFPPGLRFVACCESSYGCRLFFSPFFKKILSNIVLVERFHEMGPGLGAIHADAKIT
jgi:hypothetical protein